MPPIAVNAVLLRAAAPDLALTVGRALAARVLERGPRGIGIVNLAGAIVTAELPDHLAAGDRLRLIVRETTAERVLLQIAPQERERRRARHGSRPDPGRDEEADGDDGRDDRLDVYA